MECASTMFAPAERADHSSIAADADLLASAEFSRQLTELVPGIVLILNPQRQIVYQNRRFMTLLGADGEQEVLGKRPGELFDCIHAAATDGGCGTTVFCRECGAMKALPGFRPDDAIEGSECRLLTRRGEAYEFRVNASPYHYRGKEFTIFTMEDISDRKRRDALEKTFFHDVNNLLNIIMCYSTALKDTGEPAAVAEYTRIIQSAGQELGEEIAAHRRLLQAERGELAVNISIIESLTLLGDLVQLFYDNEKWHDRRMVIDPGSEIVGILTDRALLLRVLGNMLKNALEATETADEIRLKCRLEADRVVFSVHNPGAIAPAVFAQIFKRSFSTKGEGRGIGTYSMKLLGEQYLMGQVECSSDAASGTTFRISLPLEHPRTSL